MDRYEVQQRVGRGAYGTVHRARHKLTGKTVAIKRMNLNGNRLSIMRELCSLRNLNHENILKLIDTQCSSDTLSLITEYVSYHLNDIFRDPRRLRTDEFIVHFYRQILSGVEHIHESGIMHRDLKPENILVSTSLVVKIADFGQACLYFPDQPERDYEENVATRWYRAPELLFGCRRYTPSVDIWALGCVLAEFISGAPILQGRSDMVQMSLVFRLLGTPSETTWPTWTQMPDAGKLIFDHQEPCSDWNRIVPGASQAFIDFLMLHLKLDFSQRATATTLLRHDFLRQCIIEKPDYRIIKRYRSLDRKLLRR